MPPEAPITAPAAAAEEPARNRPRLPQQAAAPARAPAVFVPTQATQAQPTRAFNAFKDFRTTWAQAGRWANGRVCACICYHEFDRLRKTRIHHDTFESLVPCPSP
eukprot:10763972-Alexandrium_andersonii.AAC.1